MRKQTKWAVVLGAAAVMTFGAAMTTFAAGWVEEGGDWYYYNKDDEAVTEQWEKDAAGKSYWLGDDGAMVTSSWIEDGEYKYYVNANGVKVTNEWRFMYGMDDEDDSESWFYFDGNGKLYTGKKTINGKVYYFDEDGKMLTGWVNYADKVATEESNALNKDNTFYATEDGSRASGWMKLYAPEDEDEENDEYWYFFKGDGKARVNNKSTINGKAYLFDGAGRMIDGWAEKVGDAYVSIKYDTDNDTVGDYANLFYCGGADDGALKKSGWFKTVVPGEDPDDTDSSSKWFYATSSGSLNAATDSDAEGQKQKSAGDTMANDGKVNMMFKKIGSKYYAFNEKAQMVSGLVLITNDKGGDYKAGLYYFGKGDDGALKTGSASIADDDDVTWAYYFSTKTQTILGTTFNRGQGVTGPQSGKLYQNGACIGAPEDSKYDLVNVDGNDYIVNESGRIMTSVGGSGYTADNGIKFKNVAAGTGDDKGTYTVKWLPSGKDGNVASNWKDAAAYYN